MSRLREFLQAKDDQRGITLVEIVVAMSIFSMAIVLVGGLIITGVKSQNIAFEVAEGSVSARGAVVGINTAVKNAVAIRTPTATRVDVQMPENKCMSWALHDGSLKFRSYAPTAQGRSTATDATLSSWTKMVDVAKVSGRNAGVAFSSTTGSTNRSLTYNLVLGEGQGAVKAESTLYSKAPQVATVGCW